MDAIRALEIFGAIAGLTLALLSFRTRPGLMTSGIYRLTRNPRYLGLTLTAAATAVALDQLWLLPLLAIATAWLHRMVTFEEAKLREKFGAAYERYCIGVPRWI